MLEKLSHTWLYLTHCYPIPPDKPSFLSICCFPSSKPFLFKLLFCGFMLVLAMFHLNVLLCYWHTICSHVQQKVTNMRYLTFNYFSIKMAT